LHRRVATLLALLLSILAPASCGEDGGDGSDRQAASSAAESHVDPASFPETAEGQIRSLHARFVNVLNGGDVESVCDLTTRKGQRQWAEGAKSCQEGVEVFYDSAAGPPQSRPRVLEVSVDGDRAVATTSSEGGGIYPARFRIEDGLWKVDQGGAP